MFGLLNSSQVYGFQQQTTHEQHSSNNSNNNNNNSTTNNSFLTKITNHNNNKQQRQRSTSSLSDTTKETSKFFATFSSMQSMKSPTNFIEKFLKTELLNGYDTLKNYKNFQHSTTTTTTSSTSSTTATTITSATSTTSTTTTTTTTTTGKQSVGHNSHHPDGILTSFNCLQGSYRSNFDGEFYEVVNFNNNNNNNNTNNNTNNNKNNNQRIKTHKTTKITTTKTKSSPEMTIKCSKNLLSNHSQQQQSPATLQNYQKLPESEQDLPIDVLLINNNSSGASSGEFNSSDNAATTTTNTTTTKETTSSVGNNLYKRFYFGTRGGNNVKNSDVTHAQANEIPSDNSSSSISTTTTNSSAKTTTSLSIKSNDLQRSSSASSSSGDCSAATRERKKQHIIDMLSSSNNKNNQHNSNVDGTSNNGTLINDTTPNILTPERAQRRKLMQMISNYDQQNKYLQRELAKEKRRRSEELACVVKSLLCFESKLKNDMKTVNQRMQEKDAEICRLVRQNRALLKELTKLQKVARDHISDEGVVEDAGEEEVEHEENELIKHRDIDKEDLLQVDCLVLEALQCINCRKQFYDIDLKEGWTQTNTKDGARKNDDHTTEHGSSSDDTVSSSFYGARRSVRYTSKRTSGTFRDYMRSRSMNIDDPTLSNNSEENTSTISRDDSQTSYEKINIYSRTIERMHGVKCESERESEQSGIVNNNKRSASRNSNKSNGSTSSISMKQKPSVQLEEDDGIFSPTQDDDFEEDTENDRAIKIVTRRSMEFSEASPKQVYETSTDDWYASASDPEEIGGSTTSKLYGHGAVNPVLECVNQILLQQSMEEPMISETTTTTNAHIENSTYITSKSPHNLQLTQSATAATSNLPRRSSLSGRRSSRSNSHSSDGQTSRNGTLTRKRVHFSTKNSMVHVPRNDDDDEDDGIGLCLSALQCEQQTTTTAAATTTQMISTLQQQQQQQHSQYYTMNYVTQTPIQTTPPHLRVASMPTTNVIMNELAERERLETLNYESIYSNEYEPIGSELNASSNLYVDMESTAKLAVNVNSPLNIKVHKLPPALPPKPANLLKFRKSLQQLDEMPEPELLQPDCDASVTTTTDPDYCSISEVGMTNMKIVADVHKVPESEVDMQSVGVPMSELDVEVSTVASDDTFAASSSQKTEDVEEILTDIPKLPNVAAIIAPKNAKYQQQLPVHQPPLQTHSDYIIMSPKIETPNMKLHNARKLHLNANVMTTSNEFISPKLDSATLKLQLNMSNINNSQYKRKHMPNILAEINKRMSLPNSPTTPNKLLITTPTKPIIKPIPLLHSPNTPNVALLQKNLEDLKPTQNLSNLPLETEVDWYNMDAEYGEVPLSECNLTKMNESNNLHRLEEIHEDRESVATTTEDFPMESTDVNMDCGGGIILTTDNKQLIDTHISNNVNAFVNNVQLLDAKQIADANLNAAICEAINFPMIFSENNALTSGIPLTLPIQNVVKTKKMKKNLANFEKFIEGSGLSTKPLPSKRKVYFSGPFV